MAPCRGLVPHGTADTYEIAKDRTPRAGELCPLLKNALDRLLPYQVADTGMFLQVVDRADLTGNYSETSGSAMVAYALMKGARLGDAAAGIRGKGRRVLDGIRDTYLKKGEQGWELHGICASEVWDRDRTTAPTAPAPRSIT